MGVPYQMLIATGVLMNIPTDMLDASTSTVHRRGRASLHIKLPICQCRRAGAGNGLCAQRQQLQRHLPAHAGRLYHQGSGAGFLQCKEVDLLVTWLFRLTQEQYNYKMAAVIGIMVFIICAVFTLVCFRFLNKKEATFS